MGKCTWRRSTATHAGFGLRRPLGGCSTRSCRRAGRLIKASVGSCRDSRHAAHSFRSDGICVMLVGNVPPKRFSGSNLPHAPSLKPRGEKSTGRATYSSAIDGIDHRKGGISPLREFRPRLLHRSTLRRQDISGQVVAAIYGSADASETVGAGVHRRKHAHPRDAVRDLAGEILAAQIPAAEHSCWAVGSNAPRRCGKSGRTCW